MLYRKMTVALFAALFVLGFAFPVWADEQIGGTGSAMLHKLYRGVANAATGWMEIPNQASDTWRDEGPGKGLTWGVFKGIGYAIARSVAGAYEIVTFPVPVPEDYRPVMEPEFVVNEL